MGGLLVQKRADDFRRCLAEKMLTYALGRGVEYYDRPAVERIRETLLREGDTFSMLILAIVQSVPTDAVPLIPATNQSGMTPRLLLPPPSRGGALSSIVITPLARKSHTISDSVRAVTVPLPANSAHKSQSFDSVILTSLKALRAMIAITAAPMP